MLKLHDFLDILLFGICRVFNPSHLLGLPTFRSLGNPLDDVIGMCHHFWVDHSWSLAQNTNYFKKFNSFIS